MKGKSKILIFTNFYLPGYKAGGPIRSISNLVDALSDKFEFYIVTSDRDSGDKNSYSNIQIDEWMDMGKAKIYYSSVPLSRRLIKFLFSERKYDRLYLNSFFSYRYSILPLIVNRNQLKTIVAPRGEFSLGALKLKRFKKSLYIKVSICTTIYKNVIWQASSKYEYQDIQRIIKSNPLIKIAPNLPKISNTSYNNEFRGWLNLVFISRISPKKNLLYAIEILSTVKEKVIYNIYGPNEENYWEKCESKISILPPNIKVKYHGSIPNEKVFEIISQNHLFFMPTLGENYGHAIAESLNCGVPVLISDRTPWRSLENHNVGWDLPLENPDKFSKIIDGYYHLVKSNQGKDPDHIKEWFRKRTNIEITIKQNEDLFLL